MVDSNHPSVALSLSRELNWRIMAEDEGAKAIVEELAFAMKLETAGDKQQGQLIRVRTDPGAKSSKMPSYQGHEESVDCILLPPEEDNGDLLITQVNHLSLIILWLAQKKGAMLIHGAMAELPDPSGDKKKSRSVIFAGPGTVGKSTASERLPAPWKACCDDATLVLPDGSGGFQAHPWPTWSLFYGGGQKGQWDIQHEKIPLVAIFFLSQAPEDSISPLNRAEGIALLMESLQQVAGGMTRRVSLELRERIHQEQLDNVTKLTEGVKLHSLELSLTGEFWKDVEKVLSRDRSIKDATSGSREAQELLGEKALLVRYTGRSMNPSFTEPDLLEVEPYETATVRTGDVIYFKRPEDGLMVVHRVISVSGSTIQTQGDNNKTPDPYTLGQEDIVGKVVTARQGDSRRQIANGPRGALRGRLCRLRRRALVSKLRGMSRKGAGALYYRLAGTRLFRPFLSVDKRPKVVLFEVRSRKLLKLVVSGRSVGQYDQHKERWKIQMPFRLFIDVGSLPRVAARTVRKTRIHEKKTGNSLGK